MLNELSRIVVVSMIGTTLSLGDSVEGVEFTVVDVGCMMIVEFPGRSGHFISLTIYLFKVFVSAHVKSIGKAHFHVRQVLSGSQKSFLCKTLVYRRRIISLLGCGI